MFKYHIIHESVSVSFDTLTGAISHATISCNILYLKLCMYQMLQTFVSCGKPVEKPVENSLCGFSGIVSYVLDNLIGCRLRQ